MSQLNKWIILCATVLSILGSSCGKMIIPEEEPIRGGHRLTGRDFLKTGEPEGRGYGLYSYVLFGQPVSAGNRDLYEAVLSAYLAIQEIRRLEGAGAERKDLNITYLPVRETPPENPSVGWLLDHYDYARAQIILNVAGDLDSARPYIVSYATPLSVGTTVDNKRLLLQDLSGVPADLAFLWVKEFIAQARNPRYWDARAIQQLMLSLRKNIAVFARAFDDVRSAHADVGALFEAKIRTRE
jgi:hypothetical protein